VRVSRFLLIGFIAVPPFSSVPIAHPPETETREAPQDPEITEEAIARERRAAAAQEALGNRREAAAGYDRAAAAYRDRSNYERAIEAYSRALALWRTIDDRRQQGDTLYQMGRTYEYAGDFTSARRTLESALSLRVDSRDPVWEGHVLRTLGLVHYRRKAFDAALDPLARAASIFRDARAPALEAATLAITGWVYETLRQPRLAMGAYEEALRLARTAGQPRQLGVALHTMGAAQAATGDHQRALQTYAEALDIRQKLRDPGAEAVTRHAIAISERALGNLAQAQGHIEQAIALFESRRSRLTDDDLRSSFFATRRQYYEASIDVSVALAASGPDSDRHIADAFQTSARARARSLLDLIDADSPGDQWFHPLALDDIRSTLDPATALLEYCVGASGSFLFVVTHDAVRVFRLPPSTALDPLVRDVRNALAQPRRLQLGRYALAARRLYTAIVAPAEAMLAPRTRLMISADGSLHYLPFEALLTDDPRASSQDNAARYPYLVNRWAVGYLPSLSVLARVKARRATRPQAEGTALGFFGVADPVVRPRLPHARQEVAALSARFEREGARTYVGEAATETRVKTDAAFSTARRIHFATHATSDALDPARTGLLLGNAGPASGDEGMLRTSEIFRLRIRADLVVLSACDTAMGPEVRGEGPMGLARAFLYAGAASVAVSLWRVADASTSHLMSAFYGQLEPAGAVDALQAAKRTMIRSGAWSHPYYWAPFVLIGDPR
jgi:CHAT domain-containing protein